MTSREVVSLQQRRLALDELRTAHRILWAAAPRRTTVVGGILDALRAFALSSVPLPLQDLDNTASELEAARGEIRRALRRMSGAVPADRDLPPLEHAGASAMRVMIERAFIRIRDGEPALAHVEPLSSD